MPIVPLLLLGLLLSTWQIDNSANDRGSGEGPFSSGQMFLADSAKITISSPDTNLYNDNLAISSTPLLLDDGVDLLASVLNINLELDATSKYLINKDDTGHDYDFACFLIDGNACDCQVGSPWTIRGLAIRPTCLSVPPTPPDGRLYTESYFSLLVASSADVLASAIITSPVKVKVILGADKSTIVSVRTIEGQSSSDRNRVTMVMPLIIGLPNDN